MADSTTASSASSAPAAPQYTLVVKEPFGDYARGDEITDTGLIATVLAGENARHVNKVAKS